jgi:hypothetical protein
MWEPSTSAIFCKRYCTSISGGKGNQCCLSATASNRCDPRDWGFKRHRSNTFPARWSTSPVWTLCSVCFTNISVHEYHTTAFHNDFNAWDRHGHGIPQTSPCDYVSWAFINDVHRKALTVEELRKEIETIVDTTDENTLPASIQCFILRLYS